jgi:hypothetical protein
MKTVCSLLVLGMFFCVAPSIAQQPNDSPSKQLMKIEKEMLKGEETGNTEAAEKYLASDYVVKGQEGKMWDKASAIQSIKETKSGESPKESMRDFKSAILGNYALVTFTFDGQLPNMHMTMQMADVFRKEADGWKLAARTGTMLGKK